MLAQQNGNVSNEGNEANDAADHVLFAVQERLALRVKLGVVCEVIVALGEQAEGCFTAHSSALAFPYDIFKVLRHVFRACASSACLIICSSHKLLVELEVHLLSTISPHDPVHNRDILALDIVHHNLTDLRIHTPVP